MDISDLRSFRGRFQWARVRPDSTDIFEMPLPRCAAFHRIPDASPLPFLFRRLDRPRTKHEDVHKSPGALLPVRAGRHFGDAEKSPK